jgi:hypothetical protein
MSEDEITRVFGLFYTTKPSDSPEIQWVWLSKVQKIISDLGGHIDIKSVKWVWTTIFLYLQRAMSKEKLNLSRSITTTWNWEEILVLTEDQKHIKTLQDLLLIYNFKPVFVKNREEWLKIIKKKWTIKLVMSDLLKWWGMMIIRPLNEDIESVDENIFSTEKTGMSWEREIIIDMGATKPLIMTILKSLYEK